MSGLPERLMINFRNFDKRYQAFYLIFTAKQVSRLKVEVVLYDLFKTPENETQFPFIQYIDRTNKIIQFEELQNHGSYLVYISTGTTKCFNYDPEQAKEIMISNEITVLSEEDYLKSLDMTNLLALKERADTLDKLLDRDKERIVKSNQEFLALMLNYGEKIQNQKQFFYLK